MLIRKSRQNLFCPTHVLTSHFILFSFENQRTPLQFHVIHTHSHNNVYIYKLAQLIHSPSNDPVAVLESFEHCTIHVDSSLKKTRSVIKLFTLFRLSLLRLVSLDRKTKFTSIFCCERTYFSSSEVCWSMLVTNNPTLNLFHGENVVSVEETSWNLPN